MTGAEDNIGRHADDGGVDPEVVRDRILGRARRLEAAGQIGSLAVEPATADQAAYDESLYVAAWEGEGGRIYSEA